MENSVDNALEENKQKTAKQKSKKNTKSVDAYLAQINAFEEDRVTLVKQSAKKAGSPAINVGLNWCA